MLEIGLLNTTGVSHKLSWGFGLRERAAGFSPSRLGMVDWSDPVSGKQMAEKPHQSSPGFQACRDTRWAAKGCPPTP